MDIKRNSNVINYIGVGFKPIHYADIMTKPESVGWLEIHAENYMIDGGPRVEMMDTLAQRFPISVHGVGMSIGSEKGLNQQHLERLERVLNWIKPFSFSEHLAWSSHDTVFLNDLLPLPYTEETLERVARHIDEVQQKIGRQMLLENPSSYLHFSESTYSETDFLSEVVKRTNCGLLLDINNVFISAHNQNYQATQYIDEFPLNAVGEIHLGGHEYDSDGDDSVIIDSHNNEVANPVWDLYDYALRRTGAIPTLIEWDADIPEWSTLASEIQKAAHYLAPRVVVKKHA